MKSYVSRSIALVTFLVSLFCLSSGTLFAQDLQSFAAQRRAARLSQLNGTAVAATTASASATQTVNIDDSQLAQEESERVSTIERATDAVVSVVISKDLPVLKRSYESVTLGNGYTIRIPRVTQDGTQEQVIGGGTAFFISSDGKLLTNSHVVEDTTAKYTALLNDGSKVAATVIMRDPKNDVALLQVDRQNTPFLTLSSAQTIHLGQTAIAIGNALGEFRNTVSVGVVSGLDRAIDATDSEGNASESLSALIQTDAAINSGNSGGPLLDLQGDVIGMNTAVASGGQNIGFAIPVSVLRGAISASH